MMNDERRRAWSVFRVVIIEFGRHRARASVHRSSLIVHRSSCRASEDSPSAIYFFFAPAFVADLPVCGLWLPAFAGVVAEPLRFPSFPRLFVEAMVSSLPGSLHAPC
jgi:hypothetical protein